VSTTAFGADGARDFFQALHRAFDATLARQDFAPEAIDAVLSQAFDSFHGNVAIQCEDEPALACARGCAACCTLRVSASAPEVLLVARFLHAIAPPLRARGIDLLGQLREVDARTRGCDEARRLALRQRCAFVAQGVCVIYAVRPLACRGHASHDARACADAADGLAAQVPHSEGHRMVRSLVQNALQSSLRDAGRTWGLYEFNHALQLALADDGAEAAWLRGEDPLAAAAVHDIPAAEMAATFDALRPATA
jgi:hypothetical protein